MASIVWPMATCRGETTTPGMGFRSATRSPAKAGTDAASWVRRKSASRGGPCEHCQIIGAAKPHVLNADNIQVRIATKKPAHNVIC